MSAGDAVPRRLLLAPVRTERLTLRPATDADADATFRYRRLDVVARWLTEFPADLATHRATFTEPARLACGVVVEREGQVIGDLLLRVEDAYAQAGVTERARGTVAEIGWVFDPAWGGQGYATEAARELLRIGFTSGIRRVVAGCFADNEASWRLLERLGMRREAHTVQDALHRSGTWLDSLSYAMLAREWTP